MARVASVDRLAVRPPTAAELPELHRLLARSWGDVTQVGHGETWDLTALPAVVAVAGGRIVGAFTIREWGQTMELGSLDAFEPRRGVGTALVTYAVEEARRRGRTRLRATTTNDNTDGLRFYQRRGFRLVALRPGAVEESRRVKDIPATGQHGIAIRDELDLELSL